MGKMDDDLKRMREWEERIRKGDRPKYIRNIHTNEIHLTTKPGGKDSYVGTYGVQIETDESVSGATIKHFTKHLVDFEPATQDEYVAANGHKDFI